MLRPLLPTALLATSALLLAGCATDQADAPGAPADDAGLSIVATTTQVADYTRNIVGDAATVTQLLQANQSSHGYDPSAADLTAIGEADVLVVNGAGLEEWLDDAIEASGFDGELVDSSEDIELAAGAEEEAHSHEGEEHAHGGEHSHEGEEHSHEEEHAHEGGTAAAEAEPATEEHTEEGEHEHSHEFDPHVWTDPHNAMAQADTIGEALIAADEENADAYRANLDDYRARLEALDGWVHTSIEQVPVEQRLFVSNHDAFGYFLRAYDITFVGAVIPSLDDNAEVSAAEIDELVASIRETGATAVFSETSLSPAAAETIAQEAGVEVYAGEDGLYGDSLGEAGSAGATYVGSVEHNVRQLVTSWGGTPSELPAELSDEGR